MKTLTEYLKQLSDSERMILESSPILVCPSRLRMHIMSYTVKTRGDYCDIGSNPYWHHGLSDYTGQWVHTNDVLVVCGNLN